MVLLCLIYLPDIRLCPEEPVAWNKEAFNSPTRRCPKGSRMQPKFQKPCSSRKSPCFLLLGRSCRRRRGRLRLLRASGRLQNMQAEAPTCSCNGRSPTPRSPFENLNAEEPASPTPSIPNPELCYMRLIAGSVPLSKWGLHGPSIEGGSQHTPTGDRHKNTAAQAPCAALQLRKMAELMGPCVKFSITHAPPPREPGRQHGLRPVAPSPRALCDKRPKTLRGHALDPSTRRHMVLLYLTCLTSPPNSKLCPDEPVAWNSEAFNSPTHRCPEGSRMQPKLRCSSRKSPCFLLLVRSCRQRRGRLRLLRASGRLQNMQLEAPTVPATAAAQPQSLLLKT